MNTAPNYLLTSRLKLRRWKKSDLEPFAELNASAEVMRFFPKTLTREESDSMVERIENYFENNAMGLWSVELLENAAFIGFVGLQKPGIQALFMPCVEVGWRLHSDFWGRGYAVEAARASINDGFQRLNLSEIVAMTALINAPSIRVMQKLGMTRDVADDFDHPNVEVGHKVRPHLLYRLKARDAAGENLVKASPVLE